MKLKLLALAAAGVMAGAVSAQSANVTLYGVVDTSVSYERASGVAGKAGVKGTYVDAGGLSGSRWGLRGTESLGGGLNAVFVAEGGFGSDTGAMGQGNTLFGRQVFVGLNGDFGSFTMGRQYSPMFSVVCESSVDGCSSYDVAGNHSLGLAGVLRVNNSLVYATPNVGGVSASVMWGAGETLAGTNVQRTLAANLQYKGGPLYAGLGYVDVKGTAALPSTANRSWVLGGAFDAGVAKLSASYIERKATTRSLTKTTPITEFTTTSKFKSWQLGASVPFGATTALVNVGQGKEGGAKNMIFMLGADQSLSKRTTAYVRLGISNNNAESNLDMFHSSGTFGSLGASGTTASPTGPGSDERILGVGIRHRF